MMYLFSMDYRVLYYEDINQKSQIFNYIEKLKDNEQIKVLNWIKKLQEEGPNLPRPYADYLRDDIYELRVKLTGDQIRILYFFCFKDYIVLTHSFRKNTQKVPPKEIKKALICRNDFLERYTLDDLKRM